MGKKKVSPFVGRNEKLDMWQKRLQRAEAEYGTELNRMDDRERLYRGSRKYKKMTRDDKPGETTHVRNICAEIIEAQVDSNLPSPKVTALRKGDEKLAKIIEDMIRCEMDRLPMEMLNDMMERTTPIQGGAAYLLEWDRSQRTQNTVGELALTFLHPKQVIPQNGVWSGIEDMDYIFLKIPQTKNYVQERYGVSVQDESEADPEIRSVDAEGGADDLVTLNIALFRNENGGIGRYVWVNDTECEDLEDCQAPNMSRCTTCGAPEPEDEEAPTLDGTPPPEGAKTLRKGKKVCPHCGSRQWKKSADEYQELWLPVYRSDKKPFGGSYIEKDTELDEMGVEIPVSEEKPTLVPVYKPDIYPVFLQKNVSVYGRFLGESDIDKIEDQQYTTNRMHAKMIEKLVNAGSYLTLPPKADIKVDSEEMKVIRLSSPADASLIGVQTVEGNISQDAAYLAQVYEEARQAIGITDSLQGRKDATATSAKAKEFSAAQAAGRMESKRTMKRANFAALFEAIFKFKLAYADEPRPVRYRDEYGEQVYEEFNRWDFYEVDPETGEGSWNTRFLFSCDTSAPLAANQEAMWQETRMNLQSGAFGDPTALETLILFWNKMELLHYPGAAETLRFLQGQRKAKQEQESAQMAAMQAQQEMMQGAGAPADPMTGAMGGVPMGI